MGSKGKVKPPPKYSEHQKKAVMRYFFDIHSTEKVVFHPLEPMDLQCALNSERIISLFFKMRHNQKQQISES